MATHWIWYVLAPLLIGGYAFWYVRRYQRNKASFEAFATQRGWVYTERDLEWLGHCHGEPFHMVQTRPRTWHSIEGQRGNLHVQSFEYSWVHRRSSSQARRKFMQVTGIRLPFPALDVYAEPRGPIGQFVRDAGFKRAGTGDEGFDQQWVTRGPVSPAMQQWLVRHGRQVRVRDGILETWDRGRFDPQRIDPALADLEQLVPLLAGVSGR
jgi:hypothetical protein